MRKIHLFNPGSETAVLFNKAHYTPPANVAQMRRDLACLPLAYADPDDYVLGASDADLAFAATLPDQQESFAKVVTALPENESAEAEPWGISPDSPDLFRHLLAPKDAARLTMPVWKPEFRQLISRETAAECLRLLNLPNKPVLPRFMQSVPDLIDFIQNSRTTFVLKEPFSSSGRGLLWLNDGVVSAIDRKWIEGALKRQGQLSIEKALDKQLDFAMEFSSDGEGHVRFLGLSLFDTASKGAYSGNVLASQETLEQRIVALSGREAFETVKKELNRVLEHLIGPVYRGILGVDMMIYRDEKFGCLIHPCLEINLRHTMGTTALALYERHIHPSSEGSFTVSFEKQSGEALRKHQKMLSDFPLLIREGRIQSGYLSLCPVTSGTHYRAFLLVK